MTQLDAVVRLLKTEHDRLSRQIRGVSAALSAFGSAFGKTKTTPVRGKISAAGRAKIAAGQHRRWARVREGNRTTSVSPATKATAPKRTISAAGRKRIAAAQRARWAKLKGNPKTS